MIFFFSFSFSKIAARALSRTADLEKGARRNNGETNIAADFFFLKKKKVLSENF